MCFVSSWKRKRSVVCFKISLSLSLNLFLVSILLRFEDWKKSLRGLSHAILSLLTFLLTRCIVRTKQNYKFFHMEPFFLLISIFKIHRKCWCCGNAINLHLFEIFGFKYNAYHFIYVFRHSYFLSSASQFLFVTINSLSLLFTYIPLFGHKK